MQAKAETVAADVKLQVETEVGLTRLRSLGLRAESNTYSEVEKTPEPKTFTSPQIHRERETAR